MFREVLDVDYGDHADARALRKRVRECVQSLEDDEAMAQRVHRRAESLQKVITYTRESDSIPSPEGLDEITREQTQGYTEALKANVLLEEYWDIHSILVA